MVKDHRVSQKGNPLPPLHGYSFQLAARDRIVHTTTVGTPVVKH